MKDKWKVVRANGITVAQGYECRFCKCIYTEKCACQESRSKQ